MSRVLNFHMLWKKNLLMQEKNGPGSGCFHQVLSPLIQKQILLEDIIFFGETCKHKLNELELTQRLQKE